MDFFLRHMFSGFSRLDKQLTFLWELCLGFLVKWIMDIKVFS